jgi:hypothetical protein
MLRPKISIKKKFVLDSRGHYRYFFPNYNPQTKKKGIPIVINLDRSIQYSRKTGQPYPQADIRTEKQLVVFLLNNWGYGDYLIYAYLKGREGLFVFWRGELTPEGWIFQQKEYDKKEITQLEKDFIKAESEDEKNAVKEEMNDWKEINKDFNKIRRYGFHPFLSSSGRRGEVHAWNEEDNIQNNNFQELNKRANRQKRDLSVEEMNDF